MRKVIKTFQYGEHVVILETGEIARQATGSVLVRMGDTVILVSVVAKQDDESTESRNFFPLTVNYQEKSYASGRVPGGYLRREGRPHEKEVLVSRLIDRPLRPLFADGFTSEVQVIATVMSMDQAVPTDIPAIIGASAAVMLAGLPFTGPVGAARVGYRDGQYLLNPNITDLETSDLDLVIAGTKDAVIMVESEAKELPEDIMLGAVQFGHQQMQTAIDAIQEFVDEANPDAWSWQPPVADSSLVEKITNQAKEDLNQAYQIPEKLARKAQLDKIHELITSQYCQSDDADAPSKEAVMGIVHDIESQVVRQQALTGQPRIDGRDHKTVRPINIRLGVLPRAHGSALFTRGETQAIVSTTLGTERDAQMFDDSDGERRDPFILHYNFPPFCVGEVGFLSSPKRREIGHGKLAKRAVTSVMPPLDSFPYVVRVVSEITESNGSSSMATVCGSSLAMMDAGVPISSPVAGIAMGLIKEGDDYAILTDILGDEDHLGDMDFKVAGTTQGVTALQMDIKIQGITQEIMQKALEQAREGRMHILDKMGEALNKPRQQISSYAPRIVKVSINPDKIRDVIGKGGETIRKLTEETNTTIDIAEDGVIKIAALNGDDCEEAKRRIELIVADLEVGQIYEGPVVKVVDFGAFIDLLPGRQGLVHISQIAHEHVDNVYDYLSEGQIVRVKVIDIDRQGRVRLSMKQVEA